MGSLYAALIGVLVGAAGAWVKAALAIREKVHDDLRAKRLDVYPTVWKMSAALSLYPPAALTRDDLVKLNLDLRAWYFTEGGAFMSEASRARYGEVKELMCGHLDCWEGGETVPEDVYDDLARTCSAFRTALAEDLETRRQRSLLWTVSRLWGHWKFRRAFRKRRKKLPEELPWRPYPLADMPLPAPHAPPVAE
ncbi:MAG TPA: hypothetical protein VF101_13740 [Gaiellaceae bacterium]